MTWKEIKFDFNSAESLDKSRGIKKFPDQSFGIQGERSDARLDNFNVEPLRAVE